MPNWGNQGTPGNRGTQFQGGSNHQQGWRVNVTRFNNQVLQRGIRPSRGFGTTPMRGGRGYDQPLEYAQEVHQTEVKPVVGNRADTEDMGVHAVQTEMYSNFMPQSFEEQDFLGDLSIGPTWK